MKLHSSISLLFFFTAAAAAAVLIINLVASPAHAQMKHGNATYDIQLIPTHYRRVRVTYTSGLPAVFNNNTFFALSSTPLCNNGTSGGIGDNLTNPVQWTQYDKPDSYVASFDAWRDVAVAYVCISADGGNRWYMAANSAGRYHFRLWGRVPTAKIYPVHPIANAPLQVYIRNVPAGSRALLTTNPNGCKPETPTSVIAGAAAVTMTVSDNVSGALTGKFEFHPFAGTDAAYICLATQPTNNDWSLVPFDKDDTIVFREWNYENKPDPYDQITGKITFSHFKIFADGNAWARIQLSCDPAFVQGRNTHCTIAKYNETVVPTSVADWAFLLLQDGAGVAECPFPLLVQENVTHIGFDWTPQRWGRDGAMAFIYQNVPIRLAHNFFNQDALQLPNTSSFIEFNDTTDAETRFLVLPPDTYSSDYAAVSNLLVGISAFAPLANFVLTAGNPDQLTNNSATFEPTFATLAPSTTDATMSRTLSGISTQARCKFSARYAFFPDTGIPDYTMTSLVGRASIIARSAANADIGTVRDFWVYVQANALIVTGTGIAPLGVTGDIRMVEALTAEFPWRSDYAGFRFELQILHDSQKRFYWTEPDFRCIPPASGGETLAADVTALRSFFTGIDGQKLITLNWRNAANTAWNGDPCINKWVGVICRNARVVELHVVSKKLTGAIPSAIGDLLMLEVLRLSHNEFAGNLPASLSQLVRLKTFDVSNNLFRQIPNTFASVGTNQCVRRIFAQRNLLSVFPTQTIDSLSLESLRLEWNQIEGQLPNFTNPNVPLVELSVAHNKFSGYLPQSLPYQTLVVLDLSDNKFQGQIHSTWGNLKNIQYLDISHNHIDGGIPIEMASIRSGSMLTFRAQDNSIGGLIPRLPFESYDLRQNVIACPFAIAEEFANEFKVKGLLYDECDYMSLASFAIIP